MEKIEFYTKSVNKRKRWGIILTSLFVLMTAVWFIESFTFSFTLNGWVLIISAFLSIGLFHAQWIPWIMFWVGKSNLTKMKFEKELHNDKKQNNNVEKEK